MEEAIKHRAGSKPAVNDGGPAFPFAATDPSNVALQTGGMSLRDWFAGQALAGLYADSEMQISCDVAASAAYKTADAMLAAREARNA